MRRILRLGSLESPSRSLRSKLKGERWTREEGFPLLHLGHSTMTDLKSQKEALSTVQFVKQTSREQRPVQIRCRGTEVTVTDSREEQLLACSLLSVAQCVQETVHGFSDCIAVAFSSGAWAGQCHVFQAKSPREAADIAHSLQKHIKFALRLAGRKRTESVSYTPTQLHRGFSDPQVQLSTQRSSERLHVRDTMVESRSASPPPLSGSKPPDLFPGSKLVKGPPLSPRTKKLFKSRSGREREMNKQERQELVTKASVSVEDSCCQLQAACRKPHPQSPFEKVLCAIGSSNISQLRDLLDQKLLGVDSCDHDGNTLLHYAVSARSSEAVRVLGDRMASLNGPNISKLRPLHRAAVVGKTPVLRTLLEMGASVNAQDEKSRTPLHLIAGRSTHLECVWVLLEYGASISTSDSLGVRPCDMQPHLKEMQGRLIMSVCKSFAEPPEHPTSPSNISPTRMYQQRRLREYEGRDIGDLLQVVQGQAQSLRSWALARKHKVKKTLSRSFSNLSELLEVEEDEMNHQDRLKRLQFPLSAEYTPEYFELEGGAVEVQNRLNSLIRQGKSATKVMKRVSSEPELAALSTQVADSCKQQSATGSDVQAAMSEAFGALLQQFSDRPRPYTHRNQRVSTNSNLSEAFDSLQQDLQQEHHQLEGEQEEKEVVRISPQSPHKFAKQEALPRSPPVQPRSKEETVAILDNIVATIMNAAAGDLAESGKSQPEPLIQSASVKPRRKSAITRPEIKESSSSSETRRRLSLTEGISRRFPSTASILDSGPPSISSSLSSLQDHLPASHRGSCLGIASLPFDADSGEAGSQSIYRLVLLSSNKECLHTLVSHMALPRFSERLIALAKSPLSSDGLLHNIAILMQNIFEGGGAEGRKIAVEAGVMDITIKLLSARDPIPGTCLMLLNSFLVSDDDNDHLRTIVRIPCEPLLAFLEPSESDIDSGCEFQRDPSLSITTHSSSDDAAPRGLDTGPALLQPFGSKERTSSFLSATSDSSSFRSAASPTLQGNFVTQLEARRIVLKMLAVCSIHHKMKASLTDHRALSLLTDYLTSPSQENVTNAVIALANVAQNVNCHQYLLQIGIAARLKPLLNNGPRPRYHAIRLLVYLGKLKLKGLSLYQSTGYEIDCITQSNGEHQYVRGATLEKAVELLTGESRMLWGGITLPDTTAGQHPPREKISEFFLTTFHSFMHPLLLMRLLLHRLDNTGSAVEANPFSWMVEQDSLTPVHIHSIPHHHQAVLNLIHMWMEMYPNEFTSIPKLQDYITELVQRMKRFKGVYTAHAHRLRSLLHDVQRPSPKRSDNSMPSHAPERKRVPHHENLYTQCKQLVCEELLPVTIDQAIFLAALQLHIETLSDEYLRQAFSEGWKGKKHPKVFLAHLKHALPTTYIRVKNIAKRVKEKMQDFEGLSNRNAKHLYIQHCQSTPGYNCSFYSVKVPSGSKLRRSSQPQIMGISDNRLVLLDDKTKELSSSHLIQDVRKVGCSPADPCSLSIELQHTVIKVQADRESTARQIVMLLDNYGQRVLESYEQADLDEWETSWGRSPPFLHTSAGPEDTTSSPDSDDHGYVELVETLVPTNLANGAPPIHISQEDTGSPPPPHTNMEAPSKLPSAVDLSSQYKSNADDTITFCDCPPDPEFPLEINIKLLSLTEILQHPVELARQLTLLEHSKLCRISREELLQRIHLLPRPTSEPPSSSTQSLRSQSSSLASVEDGVEKLAYHFNQLANWVAHCVLQYQTPEERAWVMAQFIEVAQHCRSYHNFSSMMAIIVAGLLSPSIRRLKKTRVLIPKLQTERFKSMESLLSSKNNYKNYRNELEKTAVPAVPFVAIYTRDLRFICDGNPDYLRNGLVNLHKRRQIFAKLEEIRHFQSEHYNFEPVPALQELLESYVLVTEDELHALSHALEHDTAPRTTRPRSNSISSLTNISVFRSPAGKAATSSSQHDIRADTRM